MPGPESKFNLKVPTELEVILAKEFIIENVKQIGQSMADSGVAFRHMAVLNEVASNVGRVGLGVDVSNPAVLDFLISLINYGYVLRQVVEQNPAPAPDQIARGVN